jgi:hypothetical protein
LFDVNLGDDADDDDQGSPKVLSSLSNHIEMFITKEPEHLTQT